MKNSLLPNINNINTPSSSSAISNTVTNEHGGQLNKIARLYKIPLSEWLDLSTGINPENYPCKDIPATAWNRLPEPDDDLSQVAAKYYNCNSLIAVAGSQVAIQLLPTLFSNFTVGLIQPGYNEHEKHWRNHQHSVISFRFDPNTVNSKSLLVEKINKKINSLNALIIINPNNPSGLKFSISQLIHWHTQLQKNDGYLIVDEAFMDSIHSNSILTPNLLPNLIVLRSIGKFFGLAGARLGFIFANDKILKKITEFQGPWPISGPSRWLVGKALADKKWQVSTQKTLQKNTSRLIELLTHYSLKPSGGTDLFQWVQTDKAVVIHQKLLQQGILIRLFYDPLSLRFGHPKNEIQWQKFEFALKKLS